MGVAERKVREKKELRQEILAAAREMFAREGYESVSMRKIASKIEYSPTTIYLYFQDKQALISEICDEMFSQLYKKIEKTAAAAGPDPVDRLKAGLKMYVEFGVKHPDHYRVSLMMPHCHDEQPEPPGNQGRRTFELLVQIVTECVAAGRFRESDPFLISQSLWMMTHGVTSLWIAKAEFPWSDKPRLLDFTIDTAVGGLLR